MSRDGLESGLHALVGDSRDWVQLGVVTEIEVHDAFAYLLTVELHGGYVVQARPTYTFGFYPVAVGAEVLVALPGGDPMAAVCLAGLPSKRFPAPAAHNNTDVVMDAQGEKVVAIGSSILLGSENASEALAIASKTDARLTKIENAFALHMHPAPIIGSTLVTTTLITPSPAIGTTKVKAE